MVQDEEKATKPNVQRDLEGKFVVIDPSEKTYLVYEEGGWRAKIPADAAEAIQERVGAMQAAMKAKGKITPLDIDDFKEAWVHNHIRAIPGKRHFKKEFDLLFKTIRAEFVDGEPVDDELQPETIVVDHVEWRTNKLRISVALKGHESKMATWEKKLVKKAKKGQAAEAVQAQVQGQKVAWVQSSVRLIKGETIGDEGTWEAHCLRLFLGIFEAKDVRTAEGERVTKIVGKPLKEPLKGTTLEEIAKKAGEMIKGPLAKKGIDVSVEVRPGKGS